MTEHDDRDAHNRIGSLCKRADCPELHDPAPTAENDAPRTCGDVIFHDNRGPFACDLDPGHEPPHHRGSMTWIGTRNLATTRVTPPGVTSNTFTPHTTIRCQCPGYTIDEEGTAA